MAKAIKVTEDRRALQDQFNRDNGIVPQGLIKEVGDIMQLGKRNLKKGNSKSDKVAEYKTNYKILSEQELLKQIAQLEKKMFAYAKDLEFEKAAQLRDEVAKLHEQLVSMG
jgi:excinuclease ABC subunit B